MASAITSSFFGSAAASSLEALLAAPSVSVLVGFGWNVIWASEDEGATMTQKSGAHASTIDTGDGDSIPYNCGGIRGILQIWTV